MNVLTKRGNSARRWGMASRRKGEVHTCTGRGRAARRQRPRGPARLPSVIRFALAWPNGAAGVASARPRPVSVGDDEVDVIQDIAPDDQFERAGEDRPVAAGTSHDDPVGTVRQISRDASGAAPLRAAA